MNKWLIGLVVLVAGVAAGWYILSGQKPREESMPGQEDVTQEAPAMSGEGVEDAVVSSTDGSDESMEKGGVMERSLVTYSDTGFTPATVGVKRGTTVTFVNESTKGMWVASALHPTHQLLPGFDQLKSVARGGTYEYAFEKVGTWKYHNHVAASDTGSVVVTE